jgi:hypothetical protein
VVGMDEGICVGRGGMSTSRSAEDWTFGQTGELDEGRLDLANSRCRERSSRAEAGVAGTVVVT